MRPSNKRSRSKQNRNRTQSGNVVNRVFDSSGPEGKVRGTPQQIIDKYNQLARDAQLSNDRVATENFQQHAEHYLRLLSEAQREAEAKREAHERENRERQAQRDRERAERQEREANAPQQHDNGNNGGGNGNHGGPDNDPGSSPQPDVFEGGSERGSDPVETPEGKAENPKPARKPRKPRAPKPPKSESQGDTPESDGSSAAAE